MKTGTVNASKSLGIDMHKGTLKEGMDADILILEENPLENIKSSRSIIGIIQGGRYFDREALDNIINNVKNSFSESK